MNQKQREFLIKQVETTWQNKTRELRSTIPQKPSLNNYLVAAFLDNSIQFNDIEALKIKIRNTVIRMGKDNVLVKETADGIFNNRTVEPTVNVLAEDLFVLPDNYLKAVEEYNKIKGDIEKEINKLTDNMTTITMKIQIGSDKVLDNLISQVDNMADLNVMNSQLLLSDTKQIKNN